MARPREALTSAWVEARSRVLAQSRVIPNVFNVQNAVKQLIWTRMNRCLVVPKWAEVLEIEGRGRLGVDPKVRQLLFRGTAAINLAAGLAREGKTVLVIDAA